MNNSLFENAKYKMADVVLAEIAPGEFVEGLIMRREFWAEKSVIVYDVAELGKNWCVGRSYKLPEDKLQMIRENPRKLR